MSRGYFLVVVHGLLTVVAFLAVEHGLQGTQASVFVPHGHVALRHVESSWTRDRTCVPRIDWQILNHRPTQGSLKKILLKLIVLVSLYCLKNVTPMACLCGLHSASAGQCCLGADGLAGCCLFGYGELCRTFLSSLFIEP